MVPMLYRDLVRSRASTMGDEAAREYVDDRVVEEDKYRVALGTDNDALSFSYATVVGFHSMGGSSDYPGFTYFFHLSPADVERTLFGVISGDPGLQLPMERGIHALERSMMHWNRYSGLFRPTDDPELGLIDPRIEVVISYPIRPELFVPQAEDRPASTPPATSSMQAARGVPHRPGTVGS